MDNFKFLETHGIAQIILYLHDHPEGKRKVDCERDINLTWNSIGKCFTILFEMGITKQIPSSKDLLFALNETGEKIAENLKQIQSSLTKKEEKI